MQTVEDLIRSGQLSGGAAGGGISPAGGGYQSASAPTAPSVAPSPPTGDDLAEVILECVEAEGIDVRRLPGEHRAIALEVTPPRPPSNAPPGVYAKIGRQH